MKPEDASLQANKRSCIFIHHIINL